MWATKEYWLPLKNEVAEEIKRRFDAEGIEIPFPHRTLYAGSATEPFPVRMVAEGAPGAAESEEGLEQGPPP